MFKKIPGNKLFRISPAGEIIDSGGQKCTFPESDGKITLSLFGKARSVDPVWLGLMAHFEVNLNKSTMRWFFKLQFVDINYFPSRPVTGKWMVIPRPIYIKQSYRLVPGYTHLAVSRKGKVIDVSTGDILASSNVEGHYTTVETYDPDKTRYRSVKVHRLVALAWVPNDEPLVKSSINHKDGDKHNPHYKNLEWVDNRVNVNHAVDTGLKTDAVKVKVKDHHTGVITRHPSISRACKALDINRSLLVGFSTSKFKSLVLDRWEFKLIDDDSDWALGPKGTKSKSYHIVAWIDNIRYDVYKVSDLKNIIREKLGPLCGQFKIPNTISSSASLEAVIWMAKYSFSSRIHIEILDRPFVLKGPYLAKNLETGKIFKAKTIKTLAKLININWSVIHARLLKNTPQSFNGWAFKIDDDSEWLETYQDSPGTRQTVLMYNCETGMELEFNSLRKASAYLKVDRSTIKTAMRNNKPIKGFTIKSID